MGVIPRSFHPSLHPYCPPSPPHPLALYRWHNPPPVLHSPYSLSDTGLQPNPFGQYLFSLSLPMSSNLFPLFLFPQPNCSHPNAPHSPPPPLSIRLSTTSTPPHPPPTTYPTKLFRRISHFLNLPIHCFFTSPPWPPHSKTSGPNTHLFHPFSKKSLQSVSQSIPLRPSCGSPTLALISTALPLDSNSNIPLSPTSF